MAFRRIRERRYINSNIKLSLKEIEDQLSQLKGKKCIAICATPTENSWQGIASATEGLFGSDIFYLPQYYSQQLYTLKELNQIAQLIVKFNFEQVIISGYVSYFSQLIIPLSKYGVEVNVIYHGSHASVMEVRDTNKHFKELIKLSKEGVVSKIGFVKKDMDKTFHLLTGRDFFPILLKTDETLFSIKSNFYEGTNIGVLTHDMFRKNLYNMVSAGLLHDKATVHIKERYLTDYLGHQDRVKIHGYFDSRHDFLKVMGGMSINFYVTFSECWGQFVNESLAMGVPCLTSDVSAVLDFDPDLKRALVVKEFDNDYAIFKQSQEVLLNLEYFKKAGPAYISSLNQKADVFLADFLNS